LQQSAVCYVRIDKSNVGGSNMYLIQTFKKRHRQTVNIQRKPFWLVAVFWYDTK